MKLNFSPAVNSNNVFFQGSNPSRPASFRAPLAADVFQKTVSFKGVEKVDNSAWDDERIQRIYDNTYEKIAAQTPILSELNIEKPKLKFADKSADCMAGYDFKSNLLHVFGFIREPQVLIVRCDENGKIKQPVGVFAESKMKNTEKYFENDKSLKAIVLSDEEKEAYISAAFAHELRHWVQTHLVASTEGASEQFLGPYRSAKEDFTLLKETGELIGEDVSQIDELLEALTYGPYYKPKKLLDKNTKLKLSLHPKDTRCFSVVKHYAKGFKNVDASARGEAYMVVPHEADAFNYQFEYFNDEVQNGQCEGRRKDVMNAISATLYKDAYEAMMKMPEYGYEPLLYE